MDTENTQILIGLTTTKEKDFSEWYRQILLKSELISYTEISGCYVIRPMAYNIWEIIQEYVNKNIKKMGVQNAYFPLFVSKEALETEKNHIENFSPEISWLTRVGETELDKPLAIRATSECIIYQHFTNWIRSHRDLPLKINQWCNVVRWEMKDCVPFIRSREFLWQEGHTCYEHKTDADKEVMEILDLYTDVYEKLLAVPVIKGKKSEREKFAGADYTTTVECFIPTVGKAVQGATSHHLGQNFSKMFNIIIENANAEKQFVFQNSWGLTTRTLGVLVQCHSDDKGLVLPPAVAPLQVVIVPCGLTAKTPKENHDAIIKQCNEICTSLNDSGIRTKLDDRTNYRVGYKFNYWEMRGVCVRIEIGPNDIKNHTVCIVKRHSGEKIIKYLCDPSLCNVLEELVEYIKITLAVMQHNMYCKALEERNKHICVCDCMEKFIEGIYGKNMCLVPWCEEVKCEEEIIGYCKGKELNVKSLCIPFNQNLASELTNNNCCVIDGNKKCFCCGKPAKSYTLFGSSF